MQPQDQNHQDDTQGQQPLNDVPDLSAEQLQPVSNNDDTQGQQPLNDVPDLSAEPLQPVSNNDDTQGQPPMTPFVDGGQDQIVDESTGQLSPEQSSADFTESQGTIEPTLEPSAQPDISATNDVDMSYQSLGSPPQEIGEPQPVADEPKPFNPSEFETINNPQDNQSTDQNQTTDNDVTSEDSQPLSEEIVQAPSSDQTFENVAAQQQEQPLDTSTPAATNQEPAERVSLTDHGSFTPQEPQAIANTTVASAEEKDNIYTEICGEIIKEQEQIIGTLAVEQANYVEGLSVDPVSYHCTVTGDGSKVIDDLIEQYRDFFGHAAVEVCKEAASRFLARLPAEELPTSLR